MPHASLPPIPIQLHHRRLSIFILALAITPGCASGNAGIEPDAGSRGDGSSTPRDSGEAVSDAGTVDSGSVPTDSGSTLIDAGGSLGDAGRDAGTFAFDAGTVPFDAGRDAGATFDAGGIPCTGTPWGTVNHGFSGVAYHASSPTGPCISQMRVCNNGTMSGTYTITSCQAGCTGTPWGNVASGFSGTAYSQANAPFGMTCAQVSQTRTCTNGSMSGSYANTSCTQYPCEFAGIHFRVGSAGYNRGTFSNGDAGPASQFVDCQPDGTWSAWMNGNPAAGVGVPCEWVTPEGTVWVESTTCGYDRATGQRWRCFNGTISPVTTVCPPGP